MYHDDDFCIRTITHSACQHTQQVVYVHFVCLTCVWNRRKKQTKKMQRKREDGGRRWRLPKNCNVDTVLLGVS